MQENNQTNDTPNTSTNNDTVPQAVTDVAQPAPVVTPDPELEVVVTASQVEISANETAQQLKDNVEPMTLPEIVTEETIVTDTVPATVAKKQVLIQYSIATVVILIMGAGLLYALEQQGRVSTGIFEKISSLVNPAPAAAIVNGTKISKADYDKNLAQLITAATAQGANVADESVQGEIKKQAIDVLVNTELLRQEAYKNGAVVTAEQIEARYQEILTGIGGQEKLNAKMTELGITEVALRKDIEGEILIQGHLAKAVDVSKITVTDKELTDAYAQISGTKAPGVVVPPLTEIKAQLEAQLKTNKEQELVNTYITSLREGASIEVLI